MRNWQYPSHTSDRDLRLDFLRGYFVFVMTIDHLGMFPAWTQVLTGANRLWVSAAEGFVLISGLVLGLLYRQRIREKGWSWSVNKVGKRAFQLYALGALGRVILTTSDYLLRLFIGRESPLPDNYWHVLEGALLHVRYDYGYIDLLPLYAILLPLGLVAIYFLQRGKWPGVLLASLLLWHAARIDPRLFRLLRIIFNPAIWQFLFIIGVMLGYYRDEIRRWYEKRPLPQPLVILLIIASFGLLALNYQIAFNGLWPNWDWKAVRLLIFDKAALAPGRIILSLLIFAASYALLTRSWPVWQKTLGWLFLPLGQNALLAYLLQAGLGYVVTHLPGYPYPDHNPVWMGFVHLAAVLLVWQMTRLLAPWLDDLPALRWPHTAVPQRESASHGQTPIT